MSSLKGLSSIAKGLGAAPSLELVEEFSPPSPLQPEIREQKRPAAKIPKPLAKTKNQDYKRVMVLVKKTTEKRAYRKWEDTNPDKDFSDLVEALLSQYASGQIAV